MKHPLVQEQKRPPSSKPSALPHPRALSHVRPSQAAASRWASTSLVFDPVPRHLRIRAAAPAPSAEDATARRETAHGPKRPKPVTRAGHTQLDGCVPTEGTRGEKPGCPTQTPAPSLFVATRRLEAGSGAVPGRALSRGPPRRHPHELGPPRAALRRRRGASRQGRTRGPRRQEAARRPGHRRPPRPPRQRATLAVNSHKPLQRRNPFHCR